MSQRPWVNYHHLLYFKTIAQEGGIAKAAKKLRLGQPTLSTQMKQFEDVLGHTLFDRSKRQLQLTEAGRMVLNYATEIFKIGDEMVDSLNDHHVTSKVQVQIGIMPTVPKKIALKIFQKAQQDFDCMVSIVDGQPEELFRELRAHRLDLVVSNYPPSVSETVGFYTKSIAKLPIIVCGNPKFAKLKNHFPESINDQPFIMPYAHTKLRGDLDHYLKTRNINVNIVAEVQDTSLQKLLCVEGVGLLSISAPAIEDFVKEKDLMVLGTLQDTFDELWFIAAERRVQNPVASKIVKEFKI
ncbi:MAG: LysR family transcriptional regulator [Proteobacteria bacterium]|nr:LysR family transcriptional regulator [Pseudomonadota bacterium]